MTCFRLRMPLSAKRSAANFMAPEIEVRRAPGGHFIGQLRRNGLGVGARRDHRPWHDDGLRIFSCPFDIGDGDLAVDAVADRLDDAVLGQGCRIAAPLDVEFFG